MQLFTILLIKIIPLYLIILIGYLAGKYLHINKESIASLLIYIITPFVILNGIVGENITISALSLPLVFFVSSCLLCLLFFYISRFFYKGSERNILSFSAGIGNVGYFGLPVAIAIFGQEIAPLVILSVFGFILYENTLGFFIVAKGNNSTKQSIIHLLKLPSLYAFVLGILIYAFNISLGLQYKSFLNNFQSAYSILGMMLIGLGISNFNKISFDKKFMGLSFAAKFLAYPLLILSIIAIDLYFFHFYDSRIYLIMALMSITPLAANTVSYAILLKVHPEKTAMAVLLSTIFALVYIPFVVTILSLIIV